MTYFQRQSINEEEYVILFNIFSPFLRSTLLSQDIEEDCKFSMKKEDDGETFDVQKTHI